MTETMTISADEILSMDSDELTEFMTTVSVPDHSEVYVRVQNAGPREFNVRGIKADKIRALIFADAQLTRLEIAALSDASVSRVGEVVWGLQSDGLEFPEIPKRRKNTDSDDVVNEDATS